MGTNTAQASDPTVVTPSINLYRQPVPSKRTGALYNSFSYPTKIDPEAVALFIATHTKPGDTVLDPFGGSGSTGIAAMLCSRPTPAMQKAAEQLGLEPRWGARNAVIYELSPVGALLTQVMTHPPDVNEFRKAASRLLEQTEDRVAWMYSAESPDGQEGSIRHAIWSEVLRTTCCGKHVTFYEAAVRLDPAAIDESFVCPRCGTPNRTSACPRVASRRRDAATGKSTHGRKRVLVHVYGRTGGKTWSRPATSRDKKLAQEVAATPLPDCVPSSEMFWGDLHRSGYHKGISRVVDLYTERNVRVFGLLWSLVEKQPADLRNALRLLLLSYNAAHSTLMTRVVAKKGQKDLVLTGAQSGVLYVSALPVEKNIIEGVRRKIKTFSDSFEITRELKGQVTVRCASSTSLALPDSSVDYVFTDPPFGDFIPYAEVNQVNEAWLGEFTDRTNEVVISPAQEKSALEYGTLMARVFAEIARVLRPDGTATVVFHASKTDTWDALGTAFERAGFGVTATSVLDKVQVSFKQAVHQGGTRGDAIFLLRQQHTVREPLTKTEPMDDIVAELVETAADAEERSPQRLYSRYVTQRLHQGQPVTVGASEFYTMVNQVTEGQQ